MPETRTSRGPGRRSDPGAHEAPRVLEDEGEPERLVCTVALCPICLAVTAAQEVAPDTVEHLLKAARELFLAARSVIDVRADHLAGERGGRKPKLEKIEIA